MKFTKSGSLKGEISVPGDKSISHRAVMFGSISDGITEITNFLKGADCLSTIGCFRRLGISIEENEDTVTVHGRGLHGLSAPAEVLDAGNSGTTARLISGILSGQNFTSVITGDASVRKRPMGRVIEPLTAMGACIESMDGSGCAPLRIEGRRLHGVHYTTKVASAQVKSCILLAGLYADSPVSVTEPALSRNHTELMLRGFGADVRTEGLSASVMPGASLHGCRIDVPGDISSAAYFIAAAAIVPGSEVLIKNVGINPTRDGILKVCEMMGADVTVMNKEIRGGEPAADLLVKHSELKSCVIEGDLIPTLIDELPVIAVMACFADGTTVIRDAAELKIKESDRIEVMTENLAKMGADITASDDGMIIRGGRPLHGACIDSRLDHRIAMSFAVAAMSAEGVTEILGADCVNISYPGFYKDLESLRG